MTTYTRIGDYAVEDDMEVYTHAMNYKRKSYPLSDELKSQWGEGERKRENEFIICIFKPVEDDPNVDNKARLVACALPAPINPKVEQMAKKYAKGDMPEFPYGEATIGYITRHLAFLAGHAAAKAMEFAQWCSENDWYYVQSFMQWNNTLWPHWKTSEELYTLFLNQQK